MKHIDRCLNVIGHYFANVAMTLFILFVYSIN